MHTLGIDIGGTFTDLVLLEEATGTVYFGKTLTTYPDPTLGILTGVHQLLQKHNKHINQVRTIIHGTTLVTNAVIERKGAVTALLTTSGFEDVLEIGREMRYDIYDIFITMPTPLVPSTLRKGVTERITQNGTVHTKLDMAQVDNTIKALLKKGVQSIAVCLLHSYANDVHEQAIGKLIHTSYPQLTYSLSSAVMPEVREYERTSATVMNAYVQPLTHHYLSNLNTNLHTLGFTGNILIMNSAGRLTTVQGARATPVHLLESGPAGGTMATAFIGKLLGNNDLVAFDMGGTTAKASMIRGGKPEITNQFEAGREKRFKKGSGLPVRIPVIDMIEIGAGGGSIAYVNGLGLITVGPMSASSQPGPACYGLGGTLPTVTDADLILGFLNQNYFLGGTMQLNTQLAIQAVKIHIADPLHITVEEAAWGIHRIVNENMANAARVHIIEKGLDPRRFSMLAFGGAGPVHAFHVAKLMYAPQLIIPSGAGVLSALGFLVSPIATEAITSYISTLHNMDWDKVNTFITAMRTKGKQFLSESGIKTKRNISTTIVCDMRYQGQGHEITVAIPKVKLSKKILPEIEANFKAEYTLRYGRNIEHIPIEAVTWRVLVSEPNPTLIPTYTQKTITPKALKGYRKVYWGTQYELTPVYDRYSIKPNITITGPCIIEEHESTTVIGKHTKVKVDGYKNIIIDLA